jgi:spermidine synthase
MPNRRLLPFFCVLQLLAFAETVRAETILHKERSAYRDITVFEQAGVRCMRFTRKASARQTCVSLEDPDKLVFQYTKMMMGSLYLVPNPRRVLVVGLGGGTLPKTLSSLYPEAEIHAVEIDGAVIKVAETYFGFRTGDKVKAFEEDGRVFVKRALRNGYKYDLVLLDAFDHEYIPEHLLTKEFLEELNRVLSPGGVLAANTWSSSRLYDHESATYESVYKEFFNLKDLNRVILARQGGLPAMESVKRNSASLGPRLKRYGVEADWLLPMFSTQKDWRRDARVLTDQYSPSNLLNAR